MVPERSYAFKPGDRMGRYEFVAVLGRGTFGAVYEVRRGVLRTRIALKVLHPSWGADPQIVARFQREARAVAALRHKNIVAVYDLAQVEGHHVIEMELLRGESLGDRLKRVRRLSAEEALDVLLPIIAGVQAAHDLDLVHRDVKPENIILARESDGSEVPKLLDFGVVHMVEDDVEDMTATCQQIGTPSYMSPEQIRGDEAIDGRADQWSLAVILYVMLTGKRPFFAAKNLLQTQFLIMYHAPAPLREAGGVVPEALETVLFRALCKSRDERYPSVRDFGAALVPFARRDARVRFGALWGVADDPVEPTTTRLPMPPLVLNADNSVTTRRSAALRPTVAEERDAESEPPSAAPVIVPSTLETTQRLASRFRGKAVFASALLGVVVGLVLLGSWKAKRERREVAPKPTTITRRAMNSSPSRQPEVEVLPMSPPRPIVIALAPVSTAQAAARPREVASRPPRRPGPSRAEPADTTGNLWNNNPYDSLVEGEAPRTERAQPVSEASASAPPAPPPTTPTTVEGASNSLRPRRFQIPSG